MSKQMKILTGVLGVVVLAAVVLTMFGKPPNLPLGPLQGMLAKDEEPVVADGGTGLDMTTTDPNCDPVTGQPLDPGAGAGAGTGALADPSAGGTVDPTAGAGAVDPAAGTGSVDPNAAGTGAADPLASGDMGATADGAPVAAGSDGWNDGSRVVAAGDGSDPSRVSDTWVEAADVATDPLAGADPSVTGGTDPNAGGAMDPAAGATDPAAGGVTDPCAGVAGAGTANPTAGDPALQGGAGAGAGAAGAGAAGGAGGAAGNAAARVTTDGTNNGNNAEALRAAADATGVMQKAQISVTTTATLLPGAGGIGKPAALRRYRGTVSAASLVMRLDDAAMQQWTSAGKKVQRDLVTSFVTRLGKSYRKATRSVTIVDSAGTVLAIGDAPAGGRAGSVKLF
jgi:hypothetical protein